jgi:hypothetical protein
MGRANAPQRRSHHHRPVISFKDPLSVSGSLSFVPGHSFNFLQSTKH